MKRTIAIGLACIMLTGCATMSRLNSFNTGKVTADAQIMVEGRRLNLWVHRREDAILTGMTVADATSAGAMRGLTLGLVSGRQMDPRAIDRALSDFVAPTGCRITPVRMIGSDSINFETGYTCPAGVDLRAIIIAQSPVLMRGEPIRMP